MNLRQRRQTQFSFVYVLVAIALMWLFNEFIFRPFIIQRTQVSYDQFREDLEQGRIDEVVLGEDLIIYVMGAEEGESLEVRNTVPVGDRELISDLLAQGVTFRARAPSSGLLTTLLGWLIPFIPLLIIWYLIFQRMGGGGNLLSFGKSRAQEISGEMTGVTFENVGGINEVEVELKEIIDFLKHPERFTKMGAKLPKGVLLVGPPGTGKTLVAKATAGEAGVPFFSLSGSDFVEMFVGVGAARVRDLFEQAKEKAPCIVFIDEIDAIGQARAQAGVVQMHDEREQTLNQLLTEMDGFDPNTGVIIMAATNRPEVLDKALLRPGRFDRQIQVTPPSEGGRLQILKIHIRDVPLADGVDLERLAQITAGFSGADLANIVNEAALMAVRHGHDKVTSADFDLAIERVVAGLQRKEPLGEELRRKVAYHEGGHALVAALLPHTEPVHKVSIIPTTKGALGYTLQMPDEDRYLMGEATLKERLVVLLGGRAAEMLVFDEVSTGAANDLERATDIARRMITEFGMSEVLGPVRYTPPAGFGYLGTQTGLRQDLSPETTAKVDSEVRKIVSEAQGRALELLKTHREGLEHLAQLLQANEVVTGEEVYATLDSGIKPKIAAKPTSA